MKKDITRYRGCLKGIYKFEINQELIDVMLEKDIIYLHGPDDHEEFGASTELNFEIIFDGKIYYANEDIIFDTFLQMVDQLFQLKREDYDLLRKIKKDIFSFEDKSEQLKYLKEKRKELVDKIDNLDYFESYTEFVNHVYDAGTRDWGEIKSYDYGDQIADMIRNSTNTGGYYFYEDFVLTFSKPILDILDKNRKIKCQLDLVEKKLFELENKKSHPIKQGFTNVTQKMLLLNKIVGYQNWNELSTNMKGKILEPILGYHKDTIINAIDVLDKNKMLSTKQNIGKDINVVEDFLKKLGVTLGDLTD